jgi:hypothetical protein
VLGDCRLTPRDLKGRPESYQRSAFSHQLLRLPVGQALGPGMEGGL